jgi:uncharacterized protein
MELAAAIAEYAIASGHRSGRQRFGGSSSNDCFSSAERSAIKILRRARCIDNVAAKSRGPRRRWPSASANAPPERLWKRDVIGKQVEKLPMRVVALEEHFTVPALVRRIDPDAISRRGFRPRKAPANGPNPLELLPDIGERRLKSMDDAGIAVQVLSNSGPGPDLVPGPDGVAMAREMNDHLATAIARHPDRLAGFAALPMQRPDACADELVRAVKDLHFVGTLINGTTEGRFLDHPSYDGLLAAAVELDVPIYIHPHLPPEPVRQAYYSDLQPGAGRVLESAAWGWHSETAIHVLRMVLAGTLDRHPRLRLVIGHMGEMLPVMLARIDEVSALDIEHLKRPISRAILDQVWLTTSGIFSEPPFLAALLTFGIDRIMFSVDYPYAPNAKGRNFLDGVSLAPADMAKLTHSNADALLKLKVGA